MWSDKYYYLNIYKDESLSSDFSTNELIDFISKIPQLKKVGDFEFKNKEQFPFTQMFLLKAQSLNSWNNYDTSSISTNLITIVCEKGQNIDFKKIEKVFIRIASFLNWSFIDEETDDDITDFVIWKPEEKYTKHNTIYRK